MHETFYQFLDFDEGPGGAEPATRRREQNVSILMVLEFWEILQSEKTLANAEKMENQLSEITGVSPGGELETARRKGLKQRVPGSRAPGDAIGSARR
ncbi:hypothetical protein DEO72_LG1g2599 [Vigna unguiculata]|uniref:Uncharacterized protein n=1 Tax=Vigna unguiculata TaxID=3917 RepID=A0A4D6KN39_VIGUN|nr:hypothetical protein DEO72_LG1g2599 [Vigna unguiculata]